MLDHVLKLTFVLHKLGDDPLIILNSTGEVVAIEDMGSKVKNVETDVSSDTNKKVLKKMPPARNNQQTLNLPMDFTLPDVYDKSLVRKLNNPNEIFWGTETSRFLRLIADKMLPHTETPSNADFAFVLELLKAKYKHFITNGNKNVHAAEV